MNKYRGHHATCPQCQRSINTYTPKKGDGTARYFRAHVCHRLDRFRGGTVQHWTCRRLRAEVPGFQMNDGTRDTGDEVAR